MNIVFLDIDGVLQPWGWQNRHSNNLDSLKDRLSTVNPIFSTIDKYDIGAVYYDWSQRSIEGLKLICTMAPAQIVLSTSWRRSKTMDQLKALFYLHDLDRWISEHPSTTGFVVLDDDYRYDYEIQFPGQFILCSSELKINEAIKALTLLNQDAIVDRKTLDLGNQPYSKAAVPLI